MVQPLTPEKGEIEITHMYFGHLLFVNRWQELTFLWLCVKQLGVEGFHQAQKHNVASKDFMLNGSSFRNNYWNYFFIVF